MSFSEIFKETFLNGFSNGIDTKQVIVSLGLSCIVGLYIFFIYRLITKKTFYSATFNLSLLAMAIITAAIMLTIQSNIAMSLGMCGALSIVRFRTAVKDPMDLVFLYWSISAGIICGAGLASICVFLCVILTVALLIMRRYPGKKACKILVVNSTEPKGEKAIMEIVSKYSKTHTVKSKNVTPTSLDMVIEVKVEDDSEVVSELISVEGIKSASLLSHDGEITA